MELECMCGEGKLGELDQLQLNWDANYGKIWQVRNKLNDVWRHEELYWKQRAKTRWLKEGDANTAFFHNSTVQKRRRNRIARIKNQNGDWECNDAQGFFFGSSNDAQVRNTIETYFQNLFTSEGQRDWGDILSFVSPIITEDINSSLMAPIIDEEIRHAVFQMGALKSPGPDGFPGVFYQKYWNIIGEDMCGLVRRFFSENENIYAMNVTKIALIPKVLSPELVTQFRPIALCNYSYKVISKILANRL
ncbi:unnamed protein product [Prunus armeniaca]|uniref:Reverse transcriptase domain-containing protein n=1 Tax=Prunus armeniaca TaxID=36596 RepID=A0A6J5TT56_PRUAR|nr:unnamed protein product [Prunus armeniaca]